MAASAQAQYGTKAAPQGASKNASQITCPWLSVGSASHALGGDVSVTVSATNKDGGTCRFTRQPDAGNALKLDSAKTDALEISVNTLPRRTCPAESLQLKGIGNEASRCRVSGSRDTEMIASRVRDTPFAVVLRSRAQKEAMKSADPQNDVLEQIAEQVAGSLY